MALTCILFYNYNLDENDLPRAKVDTSWKKAPIKKPIALPNKLAATINKKVSSSKPSKD